MPADLSRRPHTSVGSVVIPEGYERRKAGGATAVVVAAAANWLVETVGSGRTVHEWAGEQPGAEPLRGRGTVYSVEAPVGGPDGSRRWAVRHYRRGGAVASLLDDRYVRVGPTRPEVETRASVAARARGVATPAVIAGVWYSSGAFYRADLVTELLPDATRLADLLFSTERDDRAIDALTVTGSLVRESGARGLTHPDLNAMNVLLRYDASGPRAYMVDLDRATVSDVPKASFGSAMLDRLERSLRKLGRSSGRPLTRAERAALRAGFQGTG